jgi:TolB-like protein
LFYSFENFTLDTDRRELHRDAEPVALEPQVFDLLEYLLRNRDRLVTRDDLIANVWGGRIVSESTLSTRIHAARQAIGDSGEAQRLLRTIQRKGIRFVGEVREGANPADSATAAPAPSLSLANRPSIAVLPFDNMSSEPDQEYFADGITEDIITALSKWRWLLVFARNSTFAFRGSGTPAKQIAAELGARYVLEGSIRHAGDRIRVTAQLIEVATDRHVWAERFDRELSDVFTVQDEITQRVVTAIDPAIGISEIDRVARERSGDVHAWEHFLRGNYYYHRYNKRDMEAARAELQQAIDIDPHFAAAHARLAAAHAMDIAVGWAKTCPSRSRPSSARPIPLSRSTISTPPRTWRWPMRACTPASSSRRSPPRAAPWSSIPIITTPISRSA